MLISAKKCLWDIPSNFLKMRVDDQSSPSRMKYLLKLPTKGTPPSQKILTVNINGSESIYTLGKNNEYFCNGIALMDTLMVCAKSVGNKIKIY